LYFLIEKPKKRTLKIDRKMKNVVAAFLFSFMLLQPVAAQNSELRKPVSLSLHQEPMSKAFASITQQTGIRFSYNSQLIDVNKKISVDVKNQPLYKVLPLILPTAVHYKQVGKHIILSISEPEKKTVPNSIYPENNADTFFIQKKYLPSSGITIDSCHRSITQINNTDEMNKKLALLALSASIAGGQMTAQTGQTQKKEESKKVVETVIKEKRASQVTFVFPLGTDGSNSPNNEYITSFNIIGGITGKVTGFELASIFNINKYSSEGIQLAGVMNHTGTPGNDEPSRNIQIAGISNYTQNGTSTQIGGVMNITDNAPAQIGGVFNISKNSNVQIGGVFNISPKSNVQIAGVFNKTDTASIQISNTINIANSSSCQLSTVNITQKGGFQLGIVNVRDTADGVSLGVINIVKKGGLMEGEISGSEIIHAAASFRSGTQKLYSILSVGYNFSDEFFVTGFGLGTEITLKNKWRLNIEGIHYNLHDKNFKQENYGGLSQIRPTVNYKFAEHFKVYAGPTLNLSVINKDFEFTAPYSIWNTTSGDMKLDSWVGFTAGVRF
jgi:hypothetical protein